MYTTKQMQIERSRSVPSWSGTSKTIRAPCGHACVIRCCSLSEPSYPRLS